MSESENEKVVREMVDAVNRHDVEAFLEYCADDVVAIYSSLNRYEGKEEWGRDLAHEWETVPDTNLRIMSMISGGNTVVLEWYWKGTITGDYHGIPATNKTYEAPGVWIIEFEKGKVKLVKYYWNPALMSDRN